ncbi:MAG: ABC transporter ATP-binding protein [Chlamydiales bacterium]|nr:ABC transporter ATP-binding protein [Chlamydiales bacterium]
MDSNTPLAVRCKGIKKSYGTGLAKVQALRGVDLEVNAGELLMLVGPSGCGKTTLISVMAGILNQDEGECLIFDKALNHLPEAEKTRLRGETIGFVFQSFNLIPTLTVAENVSIPLLINGMERISALKKARILLSEMDMQNYAQTLPLDLSGGQQQRVAIARAIIHNPKLVVCDEPTSALDHQTGMKIMEILKKLVTQKKISLIVVTHDARIFDYADKIAKMDDGHIIELGTNGKV